MIEFISDSFLTASSVSESGFIRILIGMLKVIGAVLLTILTTACLEAPMSMKQEASMVGLAFCEAVARCNPHRSVDVDACVADYVASSCDGQDCDSDSTVDAGKMDGCVAALGEMTCQVGMPTVCDDVLR